jgi:hypothetical protein
MLFSVIVEGAISLKSNTKCSLLLDLLHLIVRINKVTKIGNEGDM